MKVIVIGAGPAGIMASLQASYCGDEVILLEKNEKIGKKLFITGKGRCNITNECEPREFLKSVIHNPKFLMSAINQFSSYDTIDMCNENGCSVKTERGNRVFPMSDKSSDVIKMFGKMLDNSTVNVKLNTCVSKIVVENNVVAGVIANGEFIKADKIIIATGGKSYPGTGSNGDGYEFAKKVGHNIVDLKPALVGIDTKENVSDLAGLTLKNVKVSIIKDDKEIASEFGEMLFTHTGVSGPIILTLSSRINNESLPLKLNIDLKPAIDSKTLDDRLIKDFEQASNKDIKNALGNLTVKALLPIIMDKAQILEYKKINQITKQERMKLVNVIKGLEYNIKSLCALSTAIVTAGGVNVKEINPKNMESKIIKGLHFAGEVLDLDALTGGYNLQIALSTGFVAGRQ